ncbi:sigma-70 family RNA polymerase sigma factor [Nocardia transvalensis]|uniref:sigma-70 family RNA polymerase sigma factor n=1 Tax=Nocardia transvalensis TaxID=37333 RepID=UPI001893296C|nr:sigma-70 family RNA polymerase sigma factor [Nocardia transvalensis]MBF6333519.1 sigma-70 family RNA polymerase sigma factor [Nocardia transvalensis]
MTESRLIGRREPLLTAADEVDLAKAIEAGLYAEHLLADGHWTVAATAEDLAALAELGRQAFHRFIRANENLARFWAHRWRCGHRSGASLDHDDLTMEGLLGIIRAIQKWDYQRGLKFSTYASHWIRNFQHRAILRSSPLKLPEHAALLSQQLLDAEHHLTEKSGSRPSVQQLAQHMEVSEQVVLALLDALRPARSLDELLNADGDHGYALAALIADPSEAHSDRENAIDLPVLMHTLTRREREVIEIMFGLADGRARMVAEIAADRGLRPDLVSQVARAALTKMRAAAAQTRQAA